ncbi:hypothetical protein [Actinoplanes couchii]|uniref:Uncharacterized protein n=1 Tax=Actinoplanes couchii TaxID=403638 RepID=A0ABQ3XEY6_9ACTN|nr:hypothetical protein [Actinoplanes couchii]MDR6319921.1 hypothetical protein [Actinoplanes couchii]GID57058.1 hypothetical protein Aco03nite_054620 [Actinoplanes couchii]
MNSDLPLIVASGVAVVTPALMTLIGFVRHLMSGGDAGVAAGARNTVNYGVTGLVAVGFVVGTTWLFLDGLGKKGAVAGTAVLVLLGLGPVLPVALPRRAERPVIWLAALWLPAAERAEFREQTRAMLTRATGLQRTGYLYDLLTRALAMGIRRRRTVRAADKPGDDETLEY